VPITTSYPGVYVQELPSPVRPIVGVPTSVAAFVGLAPRGRQDFPVQVNSWSDYERQFGALDAASRLSLAVYLFFLNGGSTALIVRTGTADLPASVALSADIKLNASSPGAWGAGLVATVDTQNLFDPKNTFNLTIKENGVVQETYTGASLTTGTPQFLPNLLAASQLVVPDGDNKNTTLPAAGAQGAPKDYPLTAAPPTAAPPAADPAAPGGDPAPAGGGGGAAPPPPLGDPAAKTGIYALARADIFNILCLPADPGAPLDPDAVLAPAIKFCEEHRAILIVDPPKQWSDAPGPLDFPTVTGTPAVSAGSANAATYYPNLIVPAPGGGTMTVGPCGAIAGVWASTDAQRGVWKAPAGTAATISGVSGLTAHIDDGESGVLNPLAVNALRIIPEVGPVIWGARTTKGADQLADQWKYIPVRRTALFIEESLRRGTQWVVFEPNDEPLWSSIRLNVGTFMHGLFRQGAFQGSTPADAYLVKCDKDNNPQDQVDLGIVNILVGFAPLKPAEFVIISIQQQAGQA
jgi:phage tail sheath protein FI